MRHLRAAAPSGAPDRLAHAQPRREPQAQASAPERASTAEPRADLPETSTAPRSTGQVIALAQRRDDWQTQIEALTARTRDDQANHLERLGIVFKATEEKVRGEGLAMALLEDETTAKIADWHQARANGLRHKWERIKRCAESNDYVRASCPNGGAERHYRIGCGHRECPKCRKVAANQIRKQFKRARHALRNEAKRRRIDRTIRERFLTLTAPHYGAGTVHPKKGESFEATATERRVAVLYEAWARMADWFREHITDGLKAEHFDLCHWWRMYEWTEGADGLGHPHFHIWTHAQFMKQEELRDVWEHCLELASGEHHEVALPDVRACLESGRISGSRGRANVESELIKYMIKDLAEGTKDFFVAPVVVAQVYNMMARRRRRQTSAGLADWVERGKAKECPATCPCCGMPFNFQFVHLKTPPNFEAEREALKQFLKPERAPPATVAA